MEKKNVILLTIDCLRADHLGCLGYNKNVTPNIDKFAQKGALFTQAIVNGTNTSSSFCSILSSTYSINHPYRIVIKGDKPRPYLLHGKTLSEVLRENGYYTLAFHSNPILNVCNFMRGFIKHKGIYPVYKINYLTSKIRYKKSIVGRIIGHYLNDLKPIARANEINSEIMSILKDRIKQPLFLWVHYMDLHNPYTPKNHWPFSTSMKLILQLYKNKNIRKYVKKYLYDKELKYCDKYLGELISDLNEIGYNDDNTLFIISSDHGEGFFEHGKFHHSGRPYEELIHVPLIFRGPKIKQGLLYKKTFNMINLSPTILKYLNCEIPDTFKGKYIDINLNNAPDDFNGVISEYKDNRIQTYSYRINKWKYILTFINNQAKEEVYNLKIDPQEKNNLSNKKELKKILYEVLDRHIKKNTG